MDILSSVLMFIIAAYLLYLGFKPDSYSEDKNLEKEKTRYISFDDNAKQGLWGLVFLSNISLLPKWFKRILNIILGSAILYFLFF
ncbi:hypothetical protein [Gracilibacillus oryzae]|uniref:hypothetical protein n=1 Tax=Gracilibacillus oryzae TaxID=1672701 RepID=UPI001D190D3E|nr:hypothetical protein [Gracilibacillus oryzae]